MSDINKDADDFERQLGHLYDNYEVQVPKHGAQAIMQKIQEKASPEQTNLAGQIKDQIVDMIKKITLNRVDHAFASDDKTIQSDQELYKDEQGEVTLSVDRDDLNPEMATLTLKVSGEWISNPAHQELITHGLCLETEAGELILQGALLDGELSIVTEAYSKLPLTQKWKIISLKK